MMMNMKTSNIENEIMTKCFVIAEDYKARIKPTSDITSFKFMENSLSWAIRNNKPDLGIQIAKMLSDMMESTTN